MQRIIPCLALSCLVVGVVFSFLIAIVSGILAGSALLVGCGTASFILACVFPRHAICLFCFALPIFGNRPGSSQSFSLFIISSCIAAGLFVSTWFKRPKLSDLSENGIILLSIAYLLASCLSLINLPWGRFVIEFKSQVPSLHDYSAMSYRILALARAHEENLYYSFLSILWTSLALQFLLSIYLHYKASPERLTAPLFSLFGGLLVSLITGILDYYSVVDLRFLRALDPVVNPGDQEFRLQSFFGHSGWFAEYVTLLIPTSMVLLLLPLTFRVRICLLIAVMLIGEFVLILTFQRGGWISYPLTLFAIWTGVYVSHRLGKGESDFNRALRASLLKIVLSIPITVALSMSLLWGLSKTGHLAHGNTFQLSTYAERLKDISKASDRTEFLEAGYKLGLLSPWLGLGPESFAFQYEREFQNPNGAYYKQIELPLHGSAHNVYVQTFAGKGLLGLALLLAIYICLIKDSIFQSFKNPSLSHTQKLILLMAATFGAAFLIYGVVQEVFYVAALQFVCFIMLGIACAAGASKRASGLMHLLLVTSFVLFFVLHLSTSNMQQPTDSCDYANVYGCYKTEYDGDKIYRWCGVRALDFFASREVDGKKSIPLSVTFPRGGDSPASLQVLNGETILAEIEVKPGETVRTEVPLTAENKECPPGFPLSFRSAYYTIPVRDYKDSLDTRALSFRLNYVGKLFNASP